MSNGQSKPCKRCGTEVRPVDIGLGVCLHPTYCPTCAAKVSAEDRGERFREHLLKSGMPIELHTYDDKLGNPELLKWVQRHADGWIWLGGHSGVGKTRALARGAVVWSWHSDTWPIVKWSRMDRATTILDVHTNNQRDVADEWLAHADFCDLLILDEFGMRQTPDSVLSAIFDVLDTRYLKNRKVWIATNASGQEVARNIGEGRWEQLLRRIRERGVVRTWDGKAWREESNQERQR